MSLVAYDYSSDDGSEPGDMVQEQSATPDAISQNTVVLCHINTCNIGIHGGNNEIRLPLPAPKTLCNELNVKEEDDEFLHKKGVSDIKHTPPSISSPTKIRTRKVQIVIPSLRTFKDDENNSQHSKPIGAEASTKPRGLLSMLPKPKSVASFALSSDAVSDPINKPIVNRLIPDSVTNRTRNVPVSNASKTTKINYPPKSANNADEDSDDNDDKTDFFSFNTDEKLPEISANEIAAMVAKKAAQMAQAAKKFDDMKPIDGNSGPSGSQQIITSVIHDDTELGNKQALATLIGGNKAKRARVDNVNIIDINSADIVPSKEDFLRRKLQDETGYVPTGHLTGDWTCTSKRKSHITYLASKAQANAQELEAMWSSNRQSRRQTQSKYGF